MSWNTLSPHGVAQMQPSGVIAPDQHRCRSGQFGQPAGHRGDTWRREVQCQGSLPRRTSRKWPGSGGGTRIAYQVEGEGRPLVLLCRAVQQLPLVGSGPGRLRGEGTSSGRQQHPASLPVVRELIADPELFREHFAEFLSSYCEACLAPRWTSLDGQLQNDITSAGGRCPAAAYRRCSRNSHRRCSSTRHQPTY
jgi:hypothetical protein